MHIPDGFLAVNTWAPAWVISVSGLGYCIRRVSGALKDKMIPLMGVMAAFIFAGQMLNFPVVAGTSGHLLGGVLAAVLLGPYAGAIVIAVVLTIQCLVFQDGGLTALGANIFNMSFVGAMGGYMIYNLIRKAIGSEKGILAGTAVAAWASVVLASSVCAVQLAISGTSPLRLALPAMALVHMLIGIGEAVISVLVVGFVLKTRPDLIYNKEDA
ncbi:MAG: energy-coupling factor ABC transporter permease [Candidatus Omnitrophica bacterium]|nr:energy-coupling factor ABC transporter permease [Candidatus Omnitrophota bacterium]MBU4589663.1 energy-coupling factor ABC transporter permease [Candidatus Omnitrophota bacterium]